MFKYGNTGGCLCTLINFVALQMKTQGVFCFPCAGGSAQMFHRWRDEFPAEVDVISVEYPGRGRRISESLVDDCASIVDSLYKNIKYLLDIPCVFIGYSMGALISLELSKKLAFTNDANPILIILCAYNPNDLKCKNRGSYSDQEIIYKIRSLGGTNELLLYDRDYLDMYLPIIRNDFYLIDNFESRFDNKAVTDVMVFHGNSDEAVTKSTPMIWHSHVLGDINIHTVTGGHFFINRTGNEFLYIFQQKLKYFVG